MTIIKLVIKSFLFKNRFILFCYSFVDFCCSKTSILRRNVHSQNIQHHFIRSFNTKTKTSEFVGLGQENKIRMKKSEPSFSLQLNPELLSNVFKKGKKDKLESEKLKNLLNEENVSDEEKQKIKV